MARSRAPLVPAALGVIGALALAGVTASTRPQQGPACLHGPDETAAEKERRAQAVRVARHINTQEQRSRLAQGSFVALSALASAPPPAPGFDLSLVTDGTSYAFAVKDRLDPCGLAFFSDHAGLIYEGRALR